MVARGADVRGADGMGADGMGVGMMVLLCVCGGRAVHS